MFFLLLFFSFLFSQEELVDGVLAVVDNKNILFSEVLGETRMYAQQKGIDPQGSPLLFQDLFDSILKDKIYLQVVLVSAEKDSTIFVSYEEISRSLDERINLFSQQLGSKGALEEAFGLSLSDIKNNYWETIREELLIEKYKFSLLGRVSVTKKDVTSFFETYKDSLPLFPEKASFSLIERPVVSSPLSIKSVLVFLDSVKDSVSSGLASFDFFVKKYSEDPSVSLNGGIMETVRGDLVSEYEKLAYSLAVDSLGGPVKTKYGYHLIKLLDRVGEKIKSQHLLITTKPTEKDSLFCFSFVDSLLVLSKNDPGFFDSLSVALKLERGGLSGHYAETDLSLFPAFVSSEIKKTKPFSFSSVFSGGGSFYVLYKYSYVPPSLRNLKNSWSFVQELALNKKRSTLFDLWIEEQLEKTYVKINSF